ncbi:TIGR02453 family protein [Pedobacter yulinensis]|uniref:TIGR02453 family protein n=1 Tax=Pedobacter yulinensis TaxID=2126353 RepID=A0A2T3HQL9_9SPHI|nr:DUF2461 domain-containing protein [Pedobacter yulinensis]PST84693.1 TIGR02453 family protein [Pedobacter yulinensis]
MIKPTTLDFLSQVTRNNNREWFLANKDAYETAKQDIHELTGKIIPVLARIDPRFQADADPKKCLLRIYRDIRFSKDKTPYKTNFGISFSVGGKGVNEPGYFLQLEPGKSFLAGGSWMPEAAHLKLIRQEIDYNGSEFRGLVESPGFRKYFELSREDTLKTTPKGYDADHPEIEYLKLKSFVGIHDIADKSLFDPKFVDKLGKAFENLYPLVVFLRNALA